MFSVEIKINGTPIVFIHGRSTTFHTDGTCGYDYEIYEPEHSSLKQGRVKHRRADGIKKLLTTILVDAEKNNE